jgi:hypothetical protein
VNQFSILKVMTTRIAGGLRKAPKKGAVKQSQNLMVVANRLLKQLHNTSWLTGKKGYGELTSLFSF